MDLQREREEFEAWHYEQYLIENPNIDITNAKYVYDYAHNNALVCQLKESHFIAWQAAKARAIPEGFVLVSVDTLEECLDWAHIAKWDSTSNEVDKKIAHHAALIESAISAQEQAND